MPTAYEFDWAAAAFEQSADQIEFILGPVEASLGPDTLSGGTLGLVVEAAIDASRLNVQACVNDLRANAITARERAAVCRSHGAALAAYEQELRLWAPLDPAAEQPTPPPRPPSWVQF